MLQERNKIHFLLFLKNSVQFVLPSSECLVLHPSISMKNFFVRFATVSSSRGRTACGCTQPRNMWRVLPGSFPSYQKGSYGARALGTKPGSSWLRASRNLRNLLSK